MKLSFYQVDYKEITWRKSIHRGLRMQDGGYGSIEGLLDGLGPALRQAARLPHWHLVITEGVAIWLFLLVPFESDETARWLITSGQGQKPVVGKPHRRSSVAGV